MQAGAFFFVLPCENVLVLAVTKWLICTGIIVCGRFVGIASGKVARRTAIFPKQMKMNEGVQRRALTPRGNLDAGAVAAALPGDGSEVSSASTNEAVEATTKAAAEAARRNQESEEGGGRAVEAQSDGHIRLQESEVCIATESTQDERPTKRTLLVRQCSMDKYLDLRTLEHAVVDLGVYPSRQEVEVCVLVASCGTVAWSCAFATSRNISQMPTSLVGCWAAHASRSCRWPQTRLC